MKYYYLVSLILPLLSFASISKNYIAFDVGYSDVTLKSAAGTGSDDGPALSLSLNTNLLDKAIGIDLNLHALLARYGSLSDGEVDRKDLSATIRPYFTLGGDYHFFNIGFFDSDTDMNIWGANIPLGQNGMSYGWGHQFNFQYFNIIPNVNWFDFEDADSFRISSQLNIPFTDNYDVYFKYEYFRVDADSGWEGYTNTYLLGLNRNF